jgi:hypothetical protein
MKSEMKLPGFVANKSLIDFSESIFYTPINGANAQEQNRIQPQQLRGIEILKELPIAYAVCYWACIIGGGDWVGCGDDCHGKWG